MNKKIIILVLIVMMLPFNVNATLCGNEDRARFVDMAKNINFSYQYTEDDDVHFTIKVSNIPENFIVYDVTDVEEYTYRGSEFTITNVEKNKNYKFAIYVDDSLCKFKALYFHYLQIPAYNKYYKDELCKGIEDYKLCQKWININLSYEEWKEEVNKYIIKNQKKEQKEQKEVVKKSFLESVFVFINSYYLIIIPSLIIILIIIRIIYNKKHDLF